MNDKIQFWNIFMEYKFCKEFGMEHKEEYMEYAR